MTQTAGAPAPESLRLAPLLAVNNLVVRYGAIEALHGVSLSVEAGRIVCLIGANGAGKSSLLRCISGLVPAAAGSIEYSAAYESPAESQRAKSKIKNQKSKIALHRAPIALHRTPPHRIVELGISHVPEGRGIFATMSVLENLELGAYLRSDRATIARDLERVFTLFPRIKERLKQQAGTMSGGEQQMLAIGRALMSRPRVLLMDEPSLGLAPLLVEQIFTVIREINGQGVTVLLVEQNAHMALQIAHDAYVLETGTLAMQGPAAEIRGNDRVRKAYLGED